MARVSRSLLTGAAIAAVVAGALAVAPASASANPTPELYPTFERCETRAASIRQGSVGAWCEKEKFGRPPLVAYLWRLHISGA